MLIRRETTLPPWSSNPAPDPSSGEPVSVVSTFVAFLGAVERDPEQVHFAEYFLRSAQHGAAALPFGYDEQQRIELRREGEHVVRCEQRRHVEDHDATRHLALERSRELAHAWRVQELGGMLERTRIRNHAEALRLQVVDHILELGLAQQVVGQSLLEAHAEIVG